MEGGSSAVDGASAEKSGQQIFPKEKDKVDKDHKCESGKQIAKEKEAGKEEKCESENCRLVTWCRSIVGMGLFITVIKNIISGITDVMVKTTFVGINPITLVFLR